MENGDKGSPVLSEGNHKKYNSKYNSKSHN